VSAESPTIDDVVRNSEETPAAETPPASEPDEVSAVAAERDEYLDALRRVQADFENFRKRVQRDKEHEFRRGLTWTVDRLLPVLDAFDAARAHHPEVLEPLDGVLAAALVAIGVERIDPVGEPFDPDSHEAVAVDDDEGGGTVVEVLRAGYRCRGQLVRPAMVRVGEPEG
jgi:molecular chaperone GrpE